MMIYYPFKEQRKRTDWKHCFDYFSIFSSTSDISSFIFHRKFLFFFIVHRCIFLSLFFFLTPNKSKNQANKNSLTTNFTFPQFKLWKILLFLFGSLTEVCPWRIQQVNRRRENLTNVDGSTMKRIAQSLLNDLVHISVTRRMVKCTTTVRYKTIYIRDAAIVRRCFSLSRIWIQSNSFRFCSDRIYCSTNVFVNKYSFLFRFFTSSVIFSVKMI